MSLAQELQKTTLQLRKDRVDYAGGFQMVLGYAQATAKERGLKGGDASINDDDALAAIRKGIKICRDTIETAGPHDHTEGVLERTHRELAALEALLPAQASEGDIRSAAKDFVDGYRGNGGDPKKTMGVLMKYLGDRFGSALDRGIAAKVAREVTSA